MNKKDLTRSVSNLHESKSPPGTDHEVSKAAGNQEEVNKRASSVKIEKTRFYSESEQKDVTVATQKTGVRTTRIYKVEHQDHIKKVAIVHFQHTLLYELDQVRVIC